MNIRKLFLFFIFSFFSLLAFTSCKSKAVLASAITSKDLSTEKIINEVYNNEKDFSTLYIKSSVHYETEDLAQNVTAEIKIKKDEIILISIRFLGITMAKAIITPNEVKYYEKMGSSYFEGDFSALSQWLGTDLDFQKIQNLLTGKPLDNLKNGNYISKMEDKYYILKDSSSNNTCKICYIEAEKFVVKKQEITQKLQERNIEIQYPNYANFNQYSLPTMLNIEANQKNQKTKINIVYNTVTFNDELSFPYSTPEGYKRIFIN